MEQISSVAFIGAGSMGAPMARHVAAAGFDVTVCDSNPEVRSAFEASGARVTAQPGDCADCELVIVLVATSEQLTQVLLGPDGLRARLRPGTAPLIAVMSTVAPETMATLAEAFAATDARLMDAPVSGGVVGARRGTLTVLAGGAETHLERARPVFAAMAQQIIPCGALGAGQATKAINNVIAISNLMISAEAYAIALGYGLKLQDLIPALEAGSARNFLSRDPRDPLDTYGAWSGTAEQYRAVMDINRKDIELALTMNLSDRNLPAITALRRMLDEAGEETLDAWRLIAQSA